MMDVHLRILAEGQLDLVAHWQLVAAGYTHRQVDDTVWRRRWRQIHDGVYALGWAPLTRRQRWLAGCLTAPGSLLAGPSAVACWGFGRFDPAVVHIVRHGSGGPRHLSGVRVSRSRMLGDDIMWKGEIPILSPERALIDMAPHVSLRQTRKLVREAIRLGCTTAADVLAAAERHRGRRGVAAVREQAKVCAALPLRRAKSDAESYALERLFRAGLPLPAVNEDVGGVEADLIDHVHKRIVEIDGPQFHLFADDDEAKEAAWRAAGYTVVRLASESIFR